MLRGRTALRLFIWVAGLAVASLPLLFAVAGTPAGLDKLFLLDSYAPHVERILFLIVAVGALLIAEGVDYLLEIDRERDGVRGNFVGFLLLIVLLMVVVAALLYGVLAPQDLSACAAPSAPPDCAVARSNVRSTLTMLGALLVIAAMLKLAYFTVRPR